MPDAVGEVLERTIRRIGRHLRRRWVRIQLGDAGLIASWARPALFAGFATTDFDDSVLRQTTGNAGAQIDFSITSLHALDLVLSVGQTWAFADGRKPTSETMVSLKVLR